MKNAVYMLKLGGSVITETNKVGSARTKDIGRMLKEIKAARKATGFGLILGNGAGAAHVIAKEYRVNEGLVDGRSMYGALKTQDSVRRLNSLIVNIGMENGVYLFPFSPSSFLDKKAKRVSKGFAEHIREALRLGFIPSVYGDVVVDMEQGVSIASTEEVFAFIAPQVMPSKIILGTDVDGVFDRDPTMHRDAKLIERIDSRNIEDIISRTEGAHKIDVTGGMKSKIAMLHRMVSETGATGYIVNLRRKGALRALLLGKKVRCTTVTK